MSIRSQAQLDNLRIIGRIVRRALDATAAAVRPGITTAELDEVGRPGGTRRGVRSTQGVRLPSALCISINDEAIHGIPGRKVVQPGDLAALRPMPYASNGAAGVAEPIRGTVGLCSMDAARPLQLRDGPEVWGFCRTVL